VLPKECPQCAYLKPPRTAKCPACGFVAVAVNHVKPEAGELRELKPKPKRPDPNREWSAEDKARFFGELKAYGAQQGYRHGWASNKYREKFGVWPNAYSGVPMMRPSAETLSWIKSRAIAWAKGKAKREQVMA